MSLATYGPYVLLKEIARTDLAVSFAATCVPASTEGDRIVAVRFFTEAGLQRDELLPRLREELDAATRLNHVNVAQTFDLGQFGPRVYAVGEYVDGASLLAILEAARRANRTISPDVAAFLVAELCAGLAYAHGRRDSRGQPLHIVHTDIRPRNLLVSTNGEVKLADFGHARVRLELEGETALRREDRLQFTAPEMARLDAWDQRADVFSAGAVLYTLLAGRTLYEGLSGAELLSWARRGEFDPVLKVAGGVPEDLAAIVDAAIAPRADDRTGSATDLRTSLAGWLRSNAPGFGRHRLKTWLQKELPDALAGSLEPGEWAALARRDWQPVDARSLLSPIEGDDGVRDPVEDLLSGAASARKAAPAPPPVPTVAAAAGSRPPALPTRQPGLASASLLEEGDAPADDDVEPAARPAVPDGPAVGVEIDLDGDDERPLPAAPIRPPEPVLGEARSIARVHSEAQVEAYEDPRAAFAPERLAQQVYDDNVDPADLPDPLADADGPVKRGFPWKTAALVLVALGGFALAGQWLWEEMQRGSVSSQTAVERDRVSVFVTSRPQGAEVIVDGRATGNRTPTLVGDLTPGAQVLIELRLEGYDTPAARPVLVEQSTRELVVELQPSPHTVHLSSDPPGAAVFVDGVHQGVTPMSVGPLRVDYRRGLAVLLTLEGHLDEVISVDWRPGEAQSSYTVPLRVDPEWVAPEPGPEGL